MALRIFETKDAKYYLGLGNHFSSSLNIFEDVDFSDIDFMVFEGIGHITPNLYQNFPQYSELYKKITKDNPEINIYCVDIKSNFNNFVNVIDLLINGSFLGMGIAFLPKAKDMIKKQSRRCFLKNSGLFSLGAIFSSPLFMMIDGISGKYNIPPFNTLNNILTNTLPMPVSGFRDAIAAKKISEYLVPKHKKWNKGVQAAILYGAAHSGIETKLKNPEITNLTLKMYDYLLKSKDYNYIESLGLNRIEELKRIDNLQEVVNVYGCGLF